LVTLNDSAYIEMARHFAYRLQEESGKNVSDQIKRGYELATGHSIDGKDLSILEGLYKNALEKFNSDKENTCEMIGMNDEHNNPETAAMVVVCNAILNLDEVVTKL
jgi:hypothetical protein